MSDIDTRVRDELRTIAEEALERPNLWRHTQNRIRVRRRRRRLTISAFAIASTTTAVIVALAIGGGSTRKTTVTVQPTIPKSTLPTTPRRNTATTVAPEPDRATRTPRTVNGPLARALQSAVRPLLPSGARLVEAYDLAKGDPPAAFANYQLPNGQTLRFVRQRFSGSTPSPGNPQSLISDPATDSLTTLASGSRLLKIGHNDVVKQVLLIRPNGTVINVILYAPLALSRQPSWVSAYSLDSLAVSVVHALDRPSADLP
jgi:hypothetical protein